MDISQVMQRLQSVFDKVFAGPVKLTSETSAKDVSDWDSLTHVVLVVAVEQEFKIRFSLGEVEKLRNVGDFSDLILTRVSECQP